MPQAGDADLRPSNHGQRWDAREIELYKQALLWLALREHVPDTGHRVEDIFACKMLAVMFVGDKERILEFTAREVRHGAPLEHDEHQFQMIVAVVEEHLPLDPRNAVTIRKAGLFAIAGVGVVTKPDELFYVPRIPLDADEAKRMLGMMTIYADAADPAAGVRTYAGYTEEELRRGRPVRVR
jgi:hypothetical protein